MRRVGMLYKISSLVLLFAIVASIATPLSASAATATWTAHPASDDTSNWRGVTWSPELGIFVAVGTGGTGVMTSSDGVTWIQQTPPDATHTWRSVTWSPTLNLFVAVGQPAATSNMTIMTSPDGITWTLRTSPITNTLFGVVWSPEQAKFVTIATTSQFVTSTDGINWTATAGAGMLTPRNIIWSADDSQYVATSSNVTPRMYTSPDGVNWTPRTAPLSSLDVAYSEADGTYVAVGTNGIMSSPDGITWTTRTSPVTNLRTVAWSPENHEFAAAGVGGIVTSPDGVTWTQQTAPNTNSWDAMVWSPELYRYVAVSTDGTNRTMVGLVLIPPSEPLNLSATASGSQVNLSWTAPTFDGNSTITGYRIERSVDGGPFAAIVANTASTTTTYADTPASGGTYSYRVYALNAAGQSAASNESSVLVSVQTAESVLANTGESQGAPFAISMLLIILSIATLFIRRKLVQ